MVYGEASPAVASLSLSPQADSGCITVNYDYELWAGLERQGARFFKGAGL